MSERGQFIVLEGIGGCGKGTQTELLRQRLIGLKHSVLVTCEHTRDTPTGKLIERIIKKEEESVDPTALQLLFIADRADHTQRVIRPSLRNYDYVICDRYEASTVAYAPPGDRKYLLDTNLRVTVRPKLTVIIDVDPTIALERIGKRNDADIFDRLPKMRECQEGYRWYGRYSGNECVWVDGSGNQEEVHKRIVVEMVRRKII